MGRRFNQRRREPQIQNKDLEAQIRALIETRWGIKAYKMPQLVDITYNVRNEDIENESLHFEYKNPEKWVKDINNSDIDLFLERNLAIRVFSRLFTLYSSSEKANDIEYYQHSIAAPMPCKILNNDAERYHARCKIIETIGLERYAYGLQCNKIIDENFYRRVCKYCLGPDCFWSPTVDFNKTYEFMDSELTDESNWGTCYVFPFPFMILWMADGSDKEPVIFSPVGKLNRFAERVLKRQTDFGMCFGEAKLDVEDEFELENRRRRTYLRAIEHLIALNSKSEQIRTLKERRLILRSLNGVKFSSDPLRLDKRDRKLLVCSDFDVAILEDSSPEDKMSPIALELLSYPGFDIEISKSILGPGLHCNLKNRSNRIFRTKKKFEENEIISFFDQEICSSLFGEDESNFGKNNLSVWNLIKEDAKYEYDSIENDIKDARNHFTERFNEDFQVIENKEDEMTSLLFFLSTLNVTAMNFHHERNNLFALDYIQRLKPVQFIWFMFWYTFGNTLRTQIEMLLQNKSIYRYTETVDRLFPSHLSTSTLRTSFYWAENCSEEGFREILRSSMSNVNTIDKIDEVTAELMTFECLADLNSVVSRLMRPEDEEKTPLIPRLFDCCEKYQTITWKQIKEKVAKDIEEKQLDVQDLDWNKYPELDAWKILCKKNPSLRCFATKHHLPRYGHKEFFEVDEDDDFVLNTFNEDIPEQSAEFSERKSDISD